MRLTSTSIPTLWTRFALLVGWVLFAFVASLSAHAQVATHPYRTAQAIALQSALNTEWNLPPIAGQSLLQVAGEWSVATRNPVWIDRRIASDTKLNIESSDKTMGEVLAQIAEGLNAEIARIDRVLMIVPKSHADCIENTYWTLTTAASSAAWMRVEKVSMHWEEGAAAEDLIAEFANRYRVANASATSIEHDLWRGMRWEQVTPAAVGLCLLSGFDLGLEIEGTSLKVAPLCNATELTPAWEYRDEVQRIGREAWQAWRAHWPDAKVEKIDRNGIAHWRITASVAAHRQLVAPLALPVKRPLRNEPDLQRFTGRYRGELRNILGSLAAQLKLELTAVDLPEQILRHELDLSFENSPLEEILQKIGTAAGVRITRDAARLTVDLP